MIKPKFRQSLFIILAILILGSVFFASLRHLEACRRPNIILITLDALRPDHLGCYGYERDTSPNIDKIARGGVIFTQAIAQSSHTAGSNASLVTSTYPNKHNVHVWGDQFNPRAHFRLADSLKKHGYATAFISDQTAISVIKGFEKGFDTFNTIRTSTFGIDTDAKKVTNLVDWAIRWLTDNREKKFFLWLYFLDPHAPYTPPDPYNTIFLHDKYYNKINRKLPFTEDVFNQFAIGAIPKFVAIHNIPEADYYVSQYDGEIRYADEQIGRLRETLKNLRLDKNTLIIINSDHGEGMGEHNEYFCHSIFLYDELIRVPLIVNFDKLVAPGRKIEAQVRTIDIAPTILDIAGIAQDKSMQGNSLLPLFNASKHDFAPFSYSHFREKKCIRVNGWKLIYDAARKQYLLYDLKNDPKESKNVALDEKEKFELLKHKLDEYITNSDTQCKIITPALDKSAQEKIRSLGYLQ